MTMAAQGVRPTRGWWLRRLAVAAGMSTVVSIAVLGAALAAHDWWSDRQPMSTGGWEMLLVLPVAWLVAVVASTLLGASLTRRAQRRAGIGPGGSAWGVAIAGSLLPYAVLMVAGAVLG